MERFIETLKFDNLKVLKEEEATWAAVDKFFKELYEKCEEHRKMNSRRKFLFVVFYSGHGFINKENAL